MGDPFWRRTSFWTAVIGTVPFVWALFQGDVTQEHVVTMIGVWGTFFTGATMLRRTVYGVPRRADERTKVQVHDAVARARAESFSAKARNR